MLQLDFWNTKDTTFIPMEWTFAIVLTLLSTISCLKSGRLTNVDQAQRILKTQPYIRELGGYERLLGRKTPGTDAVSLSHGAAFVFKSAVTNDALVDAATYSMTLHPMLHAYIVSDPLGKDAWASCDRSTSELACEVIQTVKVPTALFETEWKTEMQGALNNRTFPSDGPQWKLTNIVAEDGSTSAWVFCVNHAADDQQSLNIVVKDMLEFIYGSVKSIIEIGDVKAFPPNIETAIAPEFPSWKTVSWSIFQLLNSAAGAQVLPAKVLRTRKLDPQLYRDMYQDPNKRSTFCEFFTLTAEETENLRTTSRANGVTITNALAAAVLAVTSAFFQADSADGVPSQQTQMKAKRLRFLLSVGLRSFGVDKTDFADGTVACASGAVDFVLPVAATLADRASACVAAGPQKGVGGGGTGAGAEWADFWALAQSCRDQADDIIVKNEFVPESVRLFGFGMQYADILTIVEAEARNPDTLGRGYTCGVSNVGLAKLPSPPPASTSSTGWKKQSAAVIRPVAAYYGTSHARNGVYCLLSSITVDGAFCGCLQFTNPLTTVEEAAAFKEGLLAMLRSII